MFAPAVSVVPPTTTAADPTTDAVAPPGSTTAVGAAGDGRAAVLPPATRTELPAASVVRTTVAGASFPLIVLAPGWRVWPPTTTADPGLTEAVRPLARVATGLAAPD